MTEPLGPQAAFNHAIHLINSGRVSAAAAFCRDAVERDPEDLNMTALLGAILLKLREFEAAQKHLRRAIELAPTFAKPHEDLGRLLVEQGRPAEAVEVLRAATRLDPKAEMAFFTLGRALSMAGDSDQADAAFEASFALNPQRRKLALAAEHHKAGRREEASRQYRALLAESPNDVDAMRLLAGILASQSDVEEAEALLRKAVSLAPDYALAFLDLGRLFQEQHRYAEAIECFQRTIRLQPSAAKPRHLLASTLAPVGRTEDALDTYRQVLELQPRHAGAWLGLGHTLKTVGRQREAIDAYRECIRVRPDNGETYWSLANLKTYRLTGDDMRAMESALARADELTDQSAVNFLFALAKAHEDAGDFDTAWDYYQRGNAKQRMLEHYDPVQTETANDEIIETFDGAFLQSAAGQGHPDAAPIFVLGLPRSGSTLIEQILASHSQVEGTSELPYLGRVATSLNRNRADGVSYPQAVRELRAAHFKALGHDYLQRAQVHRRSEKSRFVDKMPNNFPSIGFLHLVLPNAKIIDARRYPLDATLSCYRQLFAKGQTFVYDLTEIGEYFLEYQRLMDHWHEVLPGRVLTVQYEDLVTDFDRQLRRLLDYCELPWEDACANFHET
ncbi:MAG: sulfotransferase, partial [Gammaproteobacteria bacterium]|nr:sulfotransferase [Gammaproteobacteria bacterium]